MLSIKEKSTQPILAELLHIGLQGQPEDFLYNHNSVLEATLPDPPRLNRVLSFIAAATTSADDSMRRFDGLLGCGSFGATYSIHKEHDGDGDTAEGLVKLEDQLICSLSCSM
jgi:hypothetical protein